MHARFRAHHFESWTDVFPDRGDQSISTFEIKQAHAANVAGEVSFAYEIGEDQLVERGGENVGSIAGGSECRHKVCGNDDVPNAQRGKEYFAEGADVDDARTVVES